MTAQEYRDFLEKALEISPDLAESMEMTLEMTPLKIEELLDSLRAEVNNKDYLRISLPKPTASEAQYSKETTTIIYNGIKTHLKPAKKTWLKIHKVHGDVHGGK